MENLGPRIREIRSRRGMTLETVAKKADISASSLSYIDGAIVYKRVYHGRLENRPSRSACESRKR